MLFETYIYVFMFYISSGNLLATYWEKAAHLAYEMFSKYKYLIVNLDFPTWVFGVGISF